MGKPTGFLEYERKSRPMISPLERIKNFNDFHMPLNPEECTEQAARCMDCGIPFCQSGVSYSGTVSGCPLHNLIPEYNDEVYKGNWKEALERLLKTNNFPEFTGRVCPALCENACVCAINGSPVATHDNEYAIIEEGFVHGWVKPKPPKVRSGKKVAVIGSGPAGLAASDCLNRRGHNVVVFERADRCGGLLMYGIPNMKLEKSVIDRRLDIMQAEGVEFRTGCDIGLEAGSAEEIKREFDAVILACGFRIPRDVDVPGRSAGQIFYAVDYLTEATKNVLGDKGLSGINACNKKVVVVGGGDTGNDCVATALRQGCKDIVQLDRNPRAPEAADRADFWPLKADIYEPDYGQAEAIALFGRDPRMFSSTVKEIIPDEEGNVKEIITIRIKKSVDDNGKRVITMLEGTEQKIPCDMLILAAGFAGCEEYVTSGFGAERDKKGTIKTKEGEYMTSIPGIFAAGDARRGPSLVVWAIKEGRECAREADRFLMEYTNM